MVSTFWSSYQFDGSQFSPCYVQLVIISFKKKKTCNNLVPIVNLLKKIDDKLKITWTKLTITQKCKNPNDIFACIKQLKAKHCRPENSPPQKKKKKKPSTRLVAFWGSGSPLSVKLHAVYLVLDQLIHRVRATVLSSNWDSLNLGASVSM